MNKTNTSITVLLIVGILFLTYIYYKKCNFKKKFFKKIAVFILWLKNSVSHKFPYSHSLQHQLLKI